MKTEKTFFVDAELARKFDAAIHMDEQDPDAYIENCMMEYIHESFSRAINSCAVGLLKNGTGANPNLRTADDVELPGGLEELARMLKKIERWANKPCSAPHILLKVYLELLFAGDGDSVEKAAFAERVNDLSSDLDELEDYSKLFKYNYPQMKISICNHSHSHGLVFVERGSRVFLHPSLKEAILQRKDAFSE